MGKIKRDINLKNKNGITLIALVITIVVLIILASVAISMSLNNNGLFSRAKQAREDYQVATNKEEMLTEKIDNDIDLIVGNRNQITKYETIYENQNGDTTGTMTKSINDFDYLLAVHGTAVGDKYFTTEIILKDYPSFIFSFSSTYGSFTFNDKTFSRTVANGTASWLSNYKIYKIIGVKVG